MSDALLEAQMSVVREIAHEVDRLRNVAKLPTRRPLECVHVGSDDLVTKTALRTPRLVEAIAGQCNVFGLRVWTGNAHAPNGLSVMALDDEPLSSRDPAGRFLIVVDPVETDRVRSRLAASVITREANKQRKALGWDVQDRGTLTIPAVPGGERGWIEEETGCEVVVEPSAQMTVARP